MISGYINEEIVDSLLVPSKKAEFLSSNTQSENSIHLEPSTLKMKVFLLVKEEDIECLILRIILFSFLII